jgi:cell wall hydrolase
MYRKTVITRVVALSFALALFAAAPAAASAAASSAARTGAAAARSASATLRLGDHGAAVRSLQSSLARLAYLPPSGVDGAFGMQTWHAVVAFQGWNGIARDGIVGPQTNAALGRARVPTPWSRASGFEVHISQQVLLLVSGGRVVRAIHVSSGKPGTPTPTGHFSVQARYTMSWSVRFRVWMPLAQYFHDGYALHEFSDVPGYPASHGCVRVPSCDAQAVWRFGRVGLRVWIAR